MAAVEEVLKLLKGTSKNTRARSVFVLVEMLLVSVLPDKLGLRMGKLPFEMLARLALFGKIRTLE